MPGSTDTYLTSIAECRRMVFHLTEKALDAMRNQDEVKATIALREAQEYATHAASIREDFNSRFDHRARTTIQL